MKVYVYTGPTISHQQGKSLLSSAHFLPPVKHGDVLDAINEDVECIAIIDGYYDNVPACRHKEILQALKAGVRVVGSSSMGAMRAAELDIYGMEGIGAIYQMYKQQVIDGDDEVAIKHAPENEGFKTLNVALVNLRYNLKKMTEANLITNSEANQIIHAGKEMYFGMRTLKRILETAAEQGLNRQIVEKCQQYFQTQWYDLKQADALLLLTTLNDRLTGNSTWPEFKVPMIKRTNFLHKWNIEQAKIKTPKGPIREFEVLTQFKFTTEDYPKAKQLANERAWLNDYAKHLEVEVSQQDIDKYYELFRQKENISNDIEESNWLETRNLTLKQLKDYFSSQANVDKLFELNKEDTKTTTDLLLKYINLRHISPRKTDLEVEWNSFYHQIKVEENNFVKEVNLSEQPLKMPMDVPTKESWCQENHVTLKELDSCLKTRALLRKMASNFYIKPGIVYHELITIELKISGAFNKALDELLQIYEKISQSGVNTTWHPHWKVFIQSDPRVVLQWFCNKERVHPKVARDYVHWKGFDDFMDFVDIAHLNYIYSTALSKP